MELARKMGKEPVEVKKDTPGFIVNRLMMPHFVEAIRMLEEGVASVEDIDKRSSWAELSDGSFRADGFDRSGYRAPCHRISL